MNKRKREEADVKQTEQLERERKDTAQSKLKTLHRLEQSRQRWIPNEDFVALPKDAPTPCRYCGVPLAPADDKTEFEMARVPFDSCYSVFRLCDACDADPKTVELCKILTTLDTHNALRVITSWDNYKESFTVLRRSESKLRCIARLITNGPGHDGRVRFMTVVGDKLPLPSLCMGYVDWKMSSDTRHRHDTIDTLTESFRRDIEALRARDKAAADKNAAEYDARCAESTAAYYKERLERGQLRDDATVMENKTTSHEQEQEDSGDVKTELKTGTTDAVTESGDEVSKEDALALVPFTFHFDMGITLVDVLQHAPLHLLQTGERNALNRLLPCIGFYREPPSSPVLPP
jgi:hypothetical protein